MSPNLLRRLTLTQPHGQEHNRTRDEYRKNGAGQGTQPTGSGQMRAVTFRHGQKRAKARTNPIRRSESGASAVAGSNVATCCTAPIVLTAEVAFAIVTSSRMIFNSVLSWFASLQAH